MINIGWKLDTKTFLAGTTNPLFFYLNCPYVPGRYGNSINVLTKGLYLCDNARDSPKLLKKFVRSFQYSKFENFNKMSVLDEFFSFWKKKHVYLDLLSQFWLMRKVSLVHLRYSQETLNLQQFSVCQRSEFLINECIRHSCLLVDLRPISTIRFSGRSSEKIAMTHAQLKIFDLFIGKNRLTKGSSSIFFSSGDFVRQAIQSMSLKILHI